MTEPGENDAPVLAMKAQAGQSVGDPFGDALVSAEPEELPCSHCGGDGLCWDGADPLGNCPDEPHRCHACGGSGHARDQVIW